MYSVIDKVIPNEYMAIKHIGTVKEGKELPLDEETKKWSGSMETYTLEEKDGNTKVTVSFDADEKFSEYFSNTFPVALEKLKQLLI